MSDWPVRTRWAAALAKLVQPDRAEEATISLVDMLPMLADLPDEAFRSRSCLDAVATSQRRTIVPSYSDIRKAVFAWWRDQPARHAMLRGPSGEALTEQEALWLRYWQKREAEQFIPMNGSPGGREHVLSLIRDVAPAAARAITGERLRPNAEPSPEAREYVRQLVTSLEMPQ